MKKIVILSDRLPYPPTSGTKNLLYNYCKILNKNLGFEVVNISFLEQDDDVSLKPDFIVRTYPLKSPSGKAKLKNLVIKTLLKREFPMQVSLFWDQSIKKNIYDILDKEKPDYIISDFVRTTEYLKEYPGFKIADLQDLLSLRYKRQMQLNLATFNPYGAYLFRFPKFIQGILQAKIIKRLVLENETNLLEKYEKSVGEHYDRVMFVAQQEGELFNQRMSANKSLVVPLGVDVDYFSEKMNVEKEKNSIAFFGALSVAHNENGIIHFINDILPLIRKKKPNVKLYIIGGGVTEKIKAAANDGVFITGRVDDIRVAVKRCTVFVCPLLFGSGIKTKNLEAMAMGMPVVTTTIGAENIPAVVGRDWLVEDDDQKFAGAVLSLLDNESYRNDLGKNGQQYVKENFSWKIAETRFKEVFR
jgi:glycosyltransferase involved in cell wall biosynthesis